MDLPGHGNNTEVFGHIEKWDEIENSVEKKQMLDGEPSGLCQFCRYQTRCQTDGNGIKHTPMSTPKGVD